eukprot:8346000-Pyramimonas_sp.AAC.1
MRFSSSSILALRAVVYPSPCPSPGPRRRGRAASGKRVQDRPPGHLKSGTSHADRCPQGDGM